ncbi:cell division protein SepF [Desulforamulus aquiferis]|uniref:Cell division protein SepF n=1 Tax=Desulforamulus aquiferis TaxID=1397668 RepID=A0AAW7ZFB1_9FIRM|nr:cell division protein SepF [Desulforamulus aquiferis]MDO7787963.1 cell division protein SepF [Desulforamulus aquiferis]
MGTKMMDKFLGIIGFDDTEEQQEKATAVEQAESQHSKRKGAQVVSLHSGRQLRVVVCDPASFEEAQGIADNLKNRRAVIINLEKAEQDQARRIVDFISGTTFALGGNMQKVGQGIFLFVPSSIDIANESGRETKEKSIFPWVKSE